MNDVLDQFPVIAHHNVATWRSFREIIDAFEGDEWVFRGQGNAQWTLQSLIERCSGGNDTIAKSISVIEEFKQRSHNYLLDGYEPQNTVEWLSLMQQHGAPTRLLDLSESPFIAAYFAFEDCQNYESAALYAINKLWLRRRLLELLSGVRKTYANLSTFQSTQNLYEFRRNLVQAFETLMTDSRISAVLPIDVPRPNRRQIAQKGVYLCANDLNMSFEECLMGGDANEVKGSIHKIIAPSAIQAEALYSLRKLNIERATLFPDLDGFGRSLKDYLKEWPHRQELIKRGAGNPMLFSSTMGQEPDKGDQQP